MWFLSTLFKQKEQGNSWKEQACDKYEPLPSPYTPTQPAVELWTCR